jgi:multidrug transporter EmrE-like cation transporter
MQDEEKPEEENLLNEPTNYARTRSCAIPLLCTVWLAVSVASAIIPKELTHKYTMAPHGDYTIHPNHLQHLNPKFEKPESMRQYPGGPPEEVNAILAEKTQSPPNKIFAEKPQAPPNKILAEKSTEAELQSKDRGFSHPVFMGSLNALALMLALPVLIAWHASTATSCHSLYITINELLQEAGSCQVQGILATISATDTYSMVLMYWGLQYIPASLCVLIMVGGGILFNTICSVLFLGQKLTKMQVVGIAIVGFGTVGMLTPTLLTPFLHLGFKGEGGYAPSSSLVAVGLLSAIICSLATVAENIGCELVMSGTVASLNPFVVIWYQGCWDLVTLIPLILVDNSWLPSSNMEHLIDTSPIQLLLVFFVLSTLMKNILSNYIILCMSSMHLALLKPLRIGAAWVFNLVLYYSIGGAQGKYGGESWTGASWIELACLILIIAGLVIMNYETEDQDNTIEQSHEGQKKLLPVDA